MMTNHRESQDFISVNSTLYDFLMHQNQHLVLFLDDQLTIIQANSLSFSTLQYDSSQLLNHSLEMIIECDNNLNNHYSDSFKALREKLTELIRNQRSFSQIVQFLTNDNKKLRLLVSFTPMTVHNDKTGQDEAQILCMTNANHDMFGEVTSLEDTIHNISYTDYLTGVGNRPSLIQKIEVFFSKKDNEQHSNCLLAIVDFDDFQKIDDLYGYKIGDKLTQQIAQRIKDIIEESDSVFRVTGAKFCVLHPTKAPTIVKKWSYNILEKLTESYPVEGFDIDLQMSMGVSCLPQDANNSVDSFTCVELAYQKAAETTNQSSIVFYYPELSEHSMRALSIEKEIKLALRNDEFEVYYQPQVRLSDRQLQGFEALARWRHPTKGLVLPADFISIAEETGQIREIGKQVLEKACKQSVIWSKKGWDHIISINISMIELNTGTFLDSVTNIIKQTGVNPKCIEFELTENAFMKNLEESIDILTKLREVGISIALDDFGTGYSSLSYIKEMPLDVVKIDRTFIKNVPSNKKDSAIVKTILTLAKELSIKVVAEGMEEKAQVKFLEQKLCDYAQGFYFSEPLTVKDADKLVDGIIN